MPDWPVSRQEHKWSDVIFIGPEQQRITQAWGYNVTMLSTRKDKESIQVLYVFESLAQQRSKNHTDNVIFTVIENYRLAQDKMG